MHASDVEYLIIGGGPTGLGAATQLAEGNRDWLLLEANGELGGLAGSFVDEQGFTWDYGGHVLFSHYERFDRYANLALGSDAWYEHQRESWIWLADRFVPYPFQFNLHRLDPADRWDCVRGLVEASRRAHEPFGSFEDWMLGTMGEGICRIFLRPYNFKVWACPPGKMDYSWVGERVAVPDLMSVLKPICTGHDEVSWGPNKVFRFPKWGGTGALWKGVGRLLPAERIRLNAHVVRIDAGEKTAVCETGERIRYRKLITTMPLPALVERTPGVADPKSCEGMLFSSTHIVGIGLNGRPPPALATKCWMYFPEANSPYYRVTVFSNYSPNNVPFPDCQWSLMAEISESPDKPVDRDRLVEQTLTAMLEDKLIGSRDDVCSVAVRHLGLGYPVPFLGRNKIVDPLLRAFEAKDIFSRGRFGAWKYEVANMDHSFAQGYECATRLMTEGGEACEPTLFTPHVVNNRRNP